jgi:hypothetical protein
MECKCGGKGSRCCYVPFYIRDPATREPVRSRLGLPAQINKVPPPHPSWPSLPQASPSHISLVQASGTLNFV